jgi:hypothetical protein
MRNQLLAFVIFVPSAAASAIRRESAPRGDDCTHGADLLIRTVLEMDRVA